LIALVGQNFEIIHYLDGLEMNPKRLPAISKQKGYVIHDDFQVDMKT
jgi:hypothetical protein